MKFSAWPASSAGPALIAVAQPATVCGAGVFEHRLVGALGEADGASLTAVTVIVKVCVADVSTPPLAVPPLSCSCTVTVARAVGVRRPACRSACRWRAIAGCAENRRVVVVADDEVERLARSRSAGPALNGRRPAGDGLRAGVLAAPSGRRPW